jgi:hypothetical protein
VVIGMLRWFYAQESGLACISGRVNQGKIVLSGSRLPPHCGKWENQCAEHRAGSARLSTFPMTEPTACRQGPMVRIHLAPALSQRQNVPATFDTLSAPRWLVLRASRGGTGSKYVTLRGGVRRAMPFLLVRSGCGAQGPQYSMRTKTVGLHVVSNHSADNHLRFRLACRALDVSPKPRSLYVIIGLSRSLRAKLTRSFRMLGRGTSTNSNPSCP